MAQMTTQITAIVYNIPLILNKFCWLKINVDTSVYNNLPKKNTLTVNNLQGEN